MNWRTVRIILFRELRDLLRDRRTLLIILGVPILLYPLLGLVGALAAWQMGDHPSVVGLYGREHLPELKATSGRFSPLPAAAWFTLAPCGPTAAGIPADRLAAAAALTHAYWRYQDYPPLVVEDQFFRGCFESRYEARLLRIKSLDRFDRKPLEEREVDVILIVPPDFVTQLHANRRPELRLLSREGDELSRLAERRLNAALNRWKQGIRDVRFQRLGLPAQFDDPFEVEDEQKAKPPEKRVTDEVLHMLARFLPFLIVMWALAGALYPAIDLCAGEKERGTMETLLISPARRAEIVWGKFLAIWIYSAGTALWNLTTMGGSALVLSSLLPYPILRLTGMVWCILLLLPLAALFSAVSLALGAYARSTKEGQYYLMPLFLVTMPLTFVALLPGVELTLFWSLVPVTGTVLLLQRLMTAATLAEVPWLYFVPALSSLGLAGWLALRWAIAQFQREEVLFRDADAAGLVFWLRRWLPVRPEQPMEKPDRLVEE